MESIINHRSSIINDIVSLRQLGYTWTLPDLLRAQRHGVTAGFIRAFRSIGYDALTLDEAVSLTRHGVTADSAQRANARAGERLSIERLNARSSMNDD